MFSKKTCNKCGEKTSSKHDFCPYCGNNLIKENLEDYGMLGLNDEIDFEQNEFGGLLGNNLLNKMFGSAVKMLEKELQKEFKNQNISQKMPQGTNFEIIINGKRISPENIRFTQKIIEPEKQKRTRKTTPKMSLESIKKISKMPKHEPSTSIRRLANKVIYELDIPGVKSINDISITKLENSIEIKAFAGNKAYSKLIPINLPITNYELSDGKLTIELDTIGTKN